MEKLPANNIREFEESKANVKKVRVSDSLVQLLESLLHDDPAQRPLASQIAEFGWFSE